MTRQEILNTPEIVDFMIDKSVMVDSKMKLHKRLEELCKLAIKALEQTRWIPCTERLPEDDGWYLCTIQKETETKFAEIRFFEDTKWKAYGWNVIAWMNEPQPYKAESEEEE